jgi:hypothetical protein
MDPELRRAWTEIVTPADYDEHMRTVGQAQAAAELTQWLLGFAELREGSHITVAGAGTGQMLDFPGADTLRPHRLTFADLNPRYLAQLRERLTRNGLDGIVVMDDFEETRLAAGMDLLLATLLLEHIEWRRGVESIARLRPRACGIVMQENPPDMTTSVTPGRRVPPSLAKAMETAHATLLVRKDLVAAMAERGFELKGNAAREVADGKRLVALLFAP